MNITPPTPESNISDTLLCPHCNTSLPTHAVFCGSCGKQVNVKKNGEQQKHAENGDYDAQKQQDDDTLCIASISQKHLKRWQTSQPPKNNEISGQSHTSSTSPRALDVEVQTFLMPSPPEIELPKTELEDTQTRLKVPLQSAPFQSLPTTPNPAMSGIMQKIPETEASASLEDSSKVNGRVELEGSGYISEELTKPSIPVPVTDTKKQAQVNSSASHWFWSTIIILSAVAAGLVNFVFTDIAIRPAVVFWFLFVCPGMVIVRFLRLKEPAVEWTLALALSFAIDALVATIQSYSGKWSPGGTLSILMCFCLCGAIVQLATMSSISQYISKLWHNLHSRKLIAPLAILLALLMGLSVVVDFWSHTPRHSATLVLAVKSPTSRPTPPSTSVTAIYPLIAGTYNGTIDDLSLNVSTSLSLIRVRQSQGKMSGYLMLGSRLQGSGPFNGTIDASKHIQFTVRDATGHAMFFFEGEMLSALSLSGDYYQCSTNSIQNNQCSRVSGGYGIWTVVLAS